MADDDFGHEAQRLETAPGIGNDLRPRHGEFEFARVAVGGMRRGRRRNAHKLAYARQVGDVVFRNEHQLVLLLAGQMPQQVQELRRKVLMDK